MRKVILNVAVSLDGYIAGPNGEYDWCYTDQDYGMKEFFKRIDALFMGRKSYETTGGSQFLPKINQYVFSRTLESAEDGIVLISDNWQIEVEKIKNEKGKDIWFFGGADLAESFFKAGLIDEMLLAVHPLLLGRGKSLFPHMDARMKYTLKDSKTYSTGLVQLLYQLNQ